MNDYLGFAQESPEVKAEDYLGFSDDVKSSSDDGTQAMEYMPFDISGLSKEQLQQLREELVPTEVKEEEFTQDNGYGI